MEIRREEANGMASTFRPLPHVEQDGIEMTESGNVGPNPTVRGRCPSCGAKSLFLGNNGYVTCSVLGCKEPAAASDMLEVGDMYQNLAKMALVFSESCIERLHKR